MTSNTAPWCQDTAQTPHDGAGPGIARWRRTPHDDVARTPFDFRSWNLFLRLEHYFRARFSSSRLGSLDRLLFSFLGSQSSFGGIFMAFFYIFRLSKGDSWNSIDMKLIPIWCWLLEEKMCLLQTRSLSSTHLFVASLQLTKEIHSFFLLVGDFLLFFPLICDNLRCTKKTLSLYAFLLCSNSQQQRIKPPLLFHINSSLDTVCSCLRDTMMADSNCC